MVEFTGERVVPGKVDDDLLNEHLSRYHFAAKLAGGKHCLDAGCGVGYGTAILSQTATSAVGVDIDTATTLAAHESSASSALSFCSADVTALPFRDRQFDLSVSFEVVEHLARWQEFLQEISRVTAPSGLALISTPNRDFYAESRGESGPNPFHLHEFDHAEFASALSAVFPYVDLYGQNVVPCISFSRGIGVGEPISQSVSPSSAVRDAQFYVAICSQSPIPPISDFVYIPNAGNVLQERSRHVRLLEKELALKAQWLEEAKASLEDLHLAHESLEKEMEERSAWAIRATADLELRNRELADELDAKCKELETAVGQLHQAEVTIAERSAWATQLDTHNLELRNRIAELESSLNKLSDVITSHVGTSESLTQQVNILGHALQESEEARRRDLAFIAGLLGVKQEDQQPSHSEIMSTLRTVLETSVRRGEFLEAIRESRWIRIGRLAGIGPDLRQLPS